MADSPRERSVRLLGRALSRLEEALTVPIEHPLAIDGTIQRFEFTFELLWKAFKEELEAQGILVASPRAALSAAYSQGWIDDEPYWLAMLKDRNLAAHTYNEALAAQVYADIKLRMPELRAAYDGIVKRASTDPDQR